MQWTRSPPDYRSRMCLNWELSEMIAIVYQGVIMVEIHRDRWTLQLIKIVGFKSNG